MDLLFLSWDVKPILSYWASTDSEYARVFLRDVGLHESIGALEHAVSPLISIKHGSHSFRFLKTVRVHD